MRIAQLAGSTVLAIGLLASGGAFAQDAAAPAAKAGSADWSSMTCSDFSKLDKAHQAAIIGQISQANTGSVASNASAASTAPSGSTPAQTTASSSANGASSSGNGATAAAGPGSALTAEQLNATCKSSPNSTLGKVVPLPAVSGTAGAGASSTQTNNQ